MLINFRKELIYVKNNKMKFNGEKIILNESSEFTTSPNFLYILLFLVTFFYYTENPHTVLHGRFLINQCFGPLNESGFNHQ